MTINEKDAKVKIGDIFLTKSDRAEMENLAKHLGMVNLTQYAIHCMVEILGAHCSQTVG